MHKHVSVRACVRACTCAWDTHTCIQKYRKAVTSSHAHTYRYTYRYTYTSGVSQRSMCETYQGSFTPSTLLPLPHVLLTIPAHLHVLVHMLYCSLSRVRSLILCVPRAMHKYAFLGTAYGTCTAHDTTARICARAFAHVHDSWLYYVLRSPRTCLDKQSTRVLKPPRQGS